LCSGPFEYDWSKKLKDRKVITHAAWQWLAIGKISWFETT
jgi:hypothetical protein